MADDLDALFGAFDGDVDSNKKQVVEKNDEHVAAVPEEEAMTKSDDQDEEANDNQVPPQPSVYTSIMSKATLSHLKTSDSQNDKEEATPTDDAKEEKEIATGTSHDKSVRSYSAYPKNLPPGTVYTPVEPPKTPSKLYPFTLDPFQSQAISYIDKEESVLVAAHTSAGKTAVAEYAIAKSLQAGQRVVYTSPIKALSNQKFRDLQEEFSDVGLMTGDITINPAATCLVMTTEILRSMLYRGSELMREVAWVIYDEVHYMRDSERGVVWEESIILLPHKVRFVFLSATIPNAAQFADWIADIHHQPCHVVYTNYRPVPLQHYIFPQGSEGLHLVVDERGKFREANFQRAMATLQSGNADVAAAEAMLASGNGKGKKRKRDGKKGGHTSDLFRIVKLIMDRNLNPVIIFSFSKKDCEKYALDLNSEDYTDDVEKDLITQVYKNAIESLSEDDRNLPQVVALLPLLKRGIGIHHGGLLPILKEIVEILFSEGLIKALFATETFSIGINMPAKTVVFTNTRKWDGKDFRWVTSGEYIQMSGRAGRRGKDDRGIVIQMLDEKMEPAVCKGILYGEPDPLNSSYRISYNMLLNMMRVEDVDPEYLLRASFHQFQKEKEIPGLLEQAKDYETEAESIDLGPSDEVELVSQYYQMDQQLLVTQRKMKECVRRPEYVLKFLQTPGRFIHVVIDGECYGWGALLSCKKKQGTGTGGSAGRLAEQTDAPPYTLEVLLFCVDRHFDSVEGKERDEDIEERNGLWQGTSRLCRPVQVSVDEETIVSMRVFTIGLESIDRISAVRIFIPKNHPSEMRKDVALSVKEVQKRFPDGIPLLDPVKDLGIKDQDFMTLLARAEALTQRLAEHQVAKDLTEEDRIARVQAFEKRTDLLASAMAIKEQARSFETVTMKEDLKKMKRVLKRLGHVDANGVIQTKGRTACEINTANELVVVELIFTGVFNDLSVEQCCALLSCMTYDERNKDDDDPAKGLKSYLANPFYKLQEVARTVAKASVACKIELDEDQFVEQFNPGM
jgi:ATP-dependent RNA helicase DOB1